jgi:lysozyme
MTTEPRATNGSRVRQRVSRQGLELIKGFEGFRRKSARLPGGRYVVGYGHIRSAREGVEVSESDAEALLHYDLLPVEAAVNEWTFAPLNQNQFDALCSFAFSIGVKSFRRSDVLRRINEGAMLPAAAALEMWRRVELDGEGVIVDALVRRRAAEKALFLKPVEGHVPAPSAVLKSSIDFAAYRSMPRRRPEPVETPLDGPEAVAVRTAPQTEDAPESDWSPTKAAAATVSARLSDILAEDDLPAEEPADVSDQEAAFEAEIDGSFLQAPPAPPEDDGADETFPELDIQTEPAGYAPLETAAPAPEQAEPPEPGAPVVELPELPPFPEDGAVPADPVAQAGFDERFEAQPAASEPGFQHEPVGASAGDPTALSESLEGPNNGPYVYLFLAGLALVVAAAVTFFRTPAPGADPAGSGLGWVLGLLGVAGVAGALWAIMGREQADIDRDEEDRS